MVTIPAGHLKIPTAQKTQIKFLIDSEIYPIYLFGQAGSGKSSAAACVARAWPDVWSIITDVGDKHRWPEKQVFFSDAKNLVYEVSRRNGTQGIFNRLIKASVVILDDIGTRSMSDAATEALLEILNARQQKPMIVTCNHHPTKLEEAVGDNRISSRLLGGTKKAHVEFPQYDFRIGRKV